MLVSELAVPDFAVLGGWTARAAEPAPVLQVRQRIVMGAAWRAR
jgi:hypothetical protein